MTPFTHIICHYNEIALKGRNRNFFENRLARNIEKKLSEKNPGCFQCVKIYPGRIAIKLQKESQKKSASIRSVLENIFGLTNFSFALESDLDLERISRDCLDLINRKKFKNFRISAQRSDKRFPSTSQKINERIGAYIAQKTGKKVKLKKPEVDCRIEILERSSFIYLKKYKGPEGLPVGTGGKALTLLSGGFDSPVAAYYAIRRGVETDFVHFHSRPYTSAASLEKVEGLAKVLKKYQDTATVYFVPFAGIQKEIFMHSPQKLRVILYRRMMLRIAEAIATKKKYLALYTGDSVGQVASQTLENIKAIEEAVKIPILRPVIGFNKIEIIEKAKQIGTYEISAIPHDDCCLRFIPKHPETRANIDEVKRAEKNLLIAKMTKTALQKMEVKSF